MIAFLMTELTVDDEKLLTFLVDKILNDRLLVPGEDQVDYLDPLTPNKLLLRRSNSCLPLRVFISAKLANLFLKRWISEYLPILQQRQKWRKQSRK